MPPVESVLLVAELLPARPLEGKELVPEAGAALRSTELQDPSTQRLTFQRCRRQRRKERAAFMTAVDQQYMHCRKESFELCPFINRRQPNNPPAGKERIRRQDAGHAQHQLRSVVITLLRLALSFLKVPHRVLQGHS
uniref:Uncharacterized protein n=1 Tax=Sphaerodactylus townsendi TaxID=933632 RepID=A0ACB8G6I3_9SAUR